jgi:hypothetical protein
LPYDNKVRELVNFAKLPKISQHVLKAEACPFFELRQAMPPGINQKKIEGFIENRELRVKHSMIAASAMEKDNRFGASPRPMPIMHLTTFAAQSFMIQANTSSHALLFKSNAKECLSVNTSNAIKQKNNRRATA